MTSIRIVIVVTVLAVVGCKKKETAAGGDPGAGAAPTKTEPAKPAAAAHPSEDDCKKLQAHIFEITPASAEKLKAMSAEDRTTAIAEFVAGVAPEDITQCTEGEKSVIDCMQAAADPDKLQACIPK